jgi:general secretion pathway protein L
MTTCRIRVGRDSPTTGSFDWAIVDGSGSVLDSGTAPLRQPPAGVCELVVASDLVLLDIIPAPAAQQRRISSSLRFLVEDSAIPDPERLHVAAATASAKDTLSVGIIDRQWMKQMLTRLDHSGLIARSACPECLLPEYLPIAWTVVWNGKNGFARTGEVRGFALDSTTDGELPVSLRLALDEARGAASAPERILLRAANGSAPLAAGDWSAALGIPVEPGPDWRWAEARGKPGLDLLQGEFAPRSVDRGWMRAMGRPAILAGALAAIGVVGTAVDWGVKAYERRALLAEMQGIFRAAFGESAVVVDAPLQMNRALAQLRRQAGKIEAGDFPALFGTVADRMLDPAKHRIESIAYDNGVLTLLVRPNDAAQFSAQFNEMRSKIPIPGIEIKLESAESLGRFSLHVSASRGQQR